ncbi:MAG TPA: glycosyltransferase [Polyangiaceae bacterium]
MGRDIFTGKGMRKRLGSGFATLIVLRVRLYSSRPLGGDPNAREWVQAVTPPLGSRICLAMIVKNEAHVIERCLLSVRPLLSSWVIVDTGSTDATERVARNALAGLPGEYVFRPWKNFGHNRTESLELARGRGAYALVIDADDALEIEPAKLPRELGADGYTLPVFHGDLVYERAHLFRTALPWRYEGVLHEYAVCETAGPTPRLEGVRYLFLSGGARSLDRSSYRRDAAILEEALRAEPGHPRNLFYLAQSYRDAGLLDEAEQTYATRAALGGWEEERWYSLYQVACLRWRLNRPAHAVTSAFLAACRARPARAEAPYQLAHHCRLRERYSSAYVFAKLAASLALPDDRLFVSRSVYDWMALDEWAISAYHVGRDEEAIALNERLLGERRLPADQVRRVEANLGASRQRLLRAGG